MPYALDGNPTLSEISDAINYLLANLNAGVPAQSYPVSNDPTTGFVSNTIGNIIQYQYRYLDIKYADNNSGLNFSDNPYGRLYFGIRNDDSVDESSNPADYTWVQVTGGFGVDKVLWITTSGGRHATFAVSQEAPDQNQNWRVVPVRSIDLDNPFAVFNQYLIIKYATNSVGAGFTSTPSGNSFYGIYTSTDGSVSTDPTAYEWSPFAFGTTYKMYYRCFGGRNIDLLPSTYKPVGFIEYKNEVLNLDVSTLGTTDSIGIISDTPLIVQSPYQYFLVRYADDIFGAGISSNPTGKSFYGLQSSEVLTLDSNPADYMWFAAGGTFLTQINLWSRTASGNTVQLSLTLDAPDVSGWENISQQTDVLDPYINVYARSGAVVTNLTSPADGRLAYSTPGANGIININLDTYGQGKNTGGFTINPLTTASIAVDSFGRISQVGNTDQVRFSSMLTHATAGQTAFTFSNAQADQILVFRNGCFLKPITDYTRTSTAVTFANACVLNDVIAIYYIRLIDGTTSADKVPFVTTTVTLSNGQTVIPSTYSDGSELLFLNGVLIVDSDYSYYGTNQGYVLNNPVSGGSLVVVSFSFNNANVLIFGENYAESSAGSTNIVFATPFYRNSHLMWFNGALLRPGTDYTMPGASILTYNYTIIGALSYSGQPTQFCSFNSAGEASVSSVGSAGVLGYDVPIEFESQPTIQDMFKKMQKEINSLKRQVKLMKDSK
jgi:hypothetical protein